LKEPSTKRNPYQTIAQTENDIQRSIIFNIGREFLLPPRSDSIWLSLIPLCNKHMRLYPRG